MTLSTHVDLSGSEEQKQEANHKHQVNTYTQRALIGPNYHRLTSLSHDTVCVKIAISKHETSLDANNNDKPIEHMWTHLHTYHRNQSMPRARVQRSVNPHMCTYEK